MQGESVVEHEQVTRLPVVTVNSTDDGDVFVQRGCVSSTCDLLGTDDRPGVVAEVEAAAKGSGLGAYDRTRGPWRCDEGRRACRRVQVVRRAQPLYEPGARGLAGW